MKFLLDAHLPCHLAFLLNDQGHDAIHTLDLSQGNRTTDAQINRISVLEQRVVITKDADFVNSFFISKQPYKLLLVSTGNISNKELKEIFSKNLTQIISALADYDFLELTRTALIEHA